MKPPLQQKLLRILDANYNRAKEALRVGEDICRFFWDDAILAVRFKKSRHQLTQTVLSLPIPYRILVKARDSVKDVGRLKTVHDKGRGKSWKDILTANLKRSQEALRVLEEVSKLLSHAASMRFQKIRYELYELEKRCFQKF